MDLSRDLQSSRGFCHPTAKLFLTSGKTKARIKVVRGRNMRRGYRERHPFTGLIVGAISGFAGTVVMTQFQNIWNKFSEDIQKPRSEHDAKPGEEQKEDSTMKVAGKISEEVGRPLSRDERKKAGPWVSLRLWHCSGRRLWFDHGNATRLDYVL
jgi:hypothetical protein